MKKRLVVLGCAFAITALAVAGMGAYLKYRVFKPYELFQDRSIIELPFQLIADQGMRYVMGDILNSPEDTVPVPPETTNSDVTDPPATTVPDESTEPETSEPETTAPPTTQPPETTVPPVTQAPTIGSNFDFSDGAVGDEWFDHVLFIGDSRTCGLRDYARSGQADYFCAVSQSVFSINRSDTTVSDKNFSAQSLESLLDSRKYDKIFISLGINECGYPVNSLMNAYKSLVDSVREAQPEAKIILQGIMVVSKRMASGSSHFSKENIQSINDRIAGMTDGIHTFYIDVNESFGVDDGYLPSYMSGDGCHLYGKYYQLWEQWIRWAVGRQGL